MPKASTTKMTQQNAANMLQRVRLELARSAEFPVRQP